MTDTPVFFDYESDEYKALWAPYEQQKAVLEACSAHRDVAKKRFDEADAVYRTSQRQLNEAWNPIGAWYNEQNALRNAREREQQDKEPGNE